MLTSVRPSSVGEWQRTEEGAGALLIAPELLPDEGSKQALISTVVKVRAVQSDTLLPIADLVADGAHTWLVAGGAADPCLAALLVGSSGVADLSSARAVLHDTAAALSALHEADIAHGGVSAQTVVVNSAGVAQLAEAGLIPALLGTAATAEQDVQAWVALANLVVSQWGQADRVGSGALLRLAGRASAEGLSVVVAALAAGSAHDRTALAGVVSHLPATQSVAAAAPDVAPTVDVAPVPAVDPAATSLGKRSASNRPESSAPVRIGPGVAAAAPPAALATIDYLTANSAAARRRERRTARRRWLTTIVILALVVGYVLWRSSWTVAVHRVSVRAQPQATTACNVTIDFTGSVSVVGAGQLRYQWLRSDGTTSPVERRNVLPGQRVVTAHLLWTFSGPGDYQAVARLKVWGAGSRTAQAIARYACRS